MLRAEKLEDLPPLEPYMNIPPIADAVVISYVIWFRKIPTHLKDLSAVSVKAAQWCLDLGRDAKTEAEKKWYKKLERILKKRA